MAFVGLVFSFGLALYNFISVNFLDLACLVEGNGFDDEQASTFGAISQIVLKSDKTVIVNNK